MKSLLIRAAVICAFMSAAHASTITFSGAISGATSFSFDSDGDAIADVIFSTTDPSGFNTIGPGLNMTFIDEPGLEGTTALNPDLTVQFLDGATGTLSFGFALSATGGFATFRVFDASSSLLGATTVAAAFTSTPSGISSFQEGFVTLSFGGTAAYGEFDFTAPGSSRYIIDNFTGNFGSTESRSVPDAGGSTISLLAIAFLGMAWCRRRAGKVLFRP